MKMLPRLRSFFLKRFVSTRWYARRTQASGYCCTEPENYVASRQQLLAYIYYTKTRCRPSNNQTFDSRVTFDASRYPKRRKSSFATIVCCVKLSHCVYIASFFLSEASLGIYAQNNRRRTLGGEWRGDVEKPNGLRVPRKCATGLPMCCHPTIFTASYDATRNATQRFAKKRINTMYTETQYIFFSYMETACPSVSILPPSPSLAKADVPRKSRATFVD